MGTGAHGRYLTKHQATSKRTMLMHDAEDLAEVFGNVHAASRSMEHDNPDWRVT